jgi:YHS domain-containing protein
MKRIVCLLPVVLGLCIFSARAADEKEKSKLDGIKCPVSDKAVAEDKTVDYKGGKVYFCCGGCPDAFNKDKSKYAAKANHQLVATKQAKQGKCPFTGNSLNRDTEITVAAAKVQFCCNNCKGKAEKGKEAEQVALIFSDDNFKKGEFKVEEKK